MAFNREEDQLDAVNGTLNDSPSSSPNAEWLDGLRAIGLPGRWAATPAERAVRHPPSLVAANSVVFSSHSSCDGSVTEASARAVPDTQIDRQLGRHQPAVSRVLKEHVDRVLGENPIIYSSHSLRAGFVTEARNRRVPDPQIARHTRHRDLNMLQVYDRPSDLFNDAAPQGASW